MRRSRWLCARTVTPFPIVAPTVSLRLAALRHAQARTHGRLQHVELLTIAWKTGDTPTKSPNSPYRCIDPTIYHITADDTRQDIHESIMSRKRKVCGEDKVEWLKVTNKDAYHYRFQFAEGLNTDTEP